MTNFWHSLFTISKENPDDPEVLLRLSDELEDSLKNELHSWYPASLDKSYGGFYTDLNFRFVPDGPQQKTTVHQSRHLWTISRACLRYPDNNLYREYADFGFRFIADKLWNGKNGGFYSETNRKGDRARTDIPMSAYDQSFAIYGIVAYHRISNKPEALKLAIDTFHWLEKHMYDAEFKGYYSYINQRRKVIERPGVSSALDGKCLKGVNSILHLLEAYTELYKTWQDPLLYTRISELLDLMLNKIIQPKEYLHNYFDIDWTPVKIKNRTKSQVKKFLYLDHVSFGHDAEAVFLIHEATKILNKNDLNISLDKTKKLMDHSLHYGLDRRKGGLFAKGYYFDNKMKPTIIDKSKVWWGQSEALYTLLLLSSIYPDDERNYFAKFNQQWSYIKKYCLDHKNGGWFKNGLDRSSKERLNPKSHRWKATYHTYRALENCINLLDKRLKSLRDNISL